MITSGLYVERVSTNNNKHEQSHSSFPRVFLVVSILLVRFLKSSHSFSFLFYTKDSHYLLISRGVHCTENDKHNRQSYFNDRRNPLILIDESGLGFPSDEIGLGSTLEWMRVETSLDVVLHFSRSWCQRECTCGQCISLKISKKQ